jgi:pyruvate/2-oxoglutarate dehydrogenase complex dihydrolipoamide acyltransferase (E2) component
MKKVNFPKSGMGIDEGTIVHWLKTVGDKVQQGETIVEIETAKAIQEVEAPATGILVEILQPEGQTVPVNTDLAIIDENRG